MAHLQNAIHKGMAAIWHGIARHSKSICHVPHCYVCVRACVDQLYDCRMFTILFDSEEEKEPGQSNELCGGIFPTKKEKGSNGTCDEARFSSKLYRASVFVTTPANFTKKWKLDQKCAIAAKKFTIGGKETTQLIKKNSAPGKVKKFRLWP